MNCTIIAPPPLFSVQIVSELCGGLRASLELMSQEGFERSQEFVLTLLTANTDARVELRSRREQISTWEREKWRLWTGRGGRSSRRGRLLLPGFCF